MRRTSNDLAQVATGALVLGCFNGGELAAAAAAAEAAGAAGTSAGSEDQLQEVVVTAQFRRHRTHP